MYCSFMWSQAWTQKGLICLYCLWRWLCFKVAGESLSLCYQKGFFLPTRRWYWDIWNREGETRDKCFMKNNLSEKRMNTILDDSLLWITFKELCCEISLCLSQMADSNVKPTSRRCSDIPYCWSKNLRQKRKCGCWAWMWTMKIRKKKMNRFFISFCWWLTVNSRP